MLPPSQGTLPASGSRHPQPPLNTLGTANSGGAARVLSVRLEGSGKKRERGDRKSVSAAVFPFFFPESLASTSEHTPQLKGSLIPRQMRCVCVST